MSISPIQAFFRTTFFATIILLTKSLLWRAFSAVCGDRKPADGGGPERIMNRMKKFLIKGALTISTLLLSALPALPSSIVLNFGAGTPPTSTLTTTNSGSTGIIFQLTNSASNINSSLLGADSGLYLVESAGVWTLSGEFDGIGTSGSTSTAGTKLLQFTATQPTISGGTAAISASTTLTYIDGSLATALGISGTASADSANFGVGNTVGGAFNSITGTTIQGVTYNFDPTSINVQLTLASTPEPASLLLFGSALLILGMVSRSRRLAVKPLV